MLFDDVVGGCDVEEEAREQRIFEESGRCLQSTLTLEVLDLSRTFR